ncbi:MAG TPA: TrbC/VirB2 family protein [Verrucomicrobiae bacterium]|nr:TrbC/VirB2 family protein [Verrucomicrobiae bacterium]
MIYTLADLHSDAHQGLDQVGGGGINIESVFTTIVDILSIVVGVIAIIVIIYSGLKYITSGGDANKVGSAKNTLIYALIGLAIAALAQFLVHFVLFQTTKT